MAIGILTEEDLQPIAEAINSIAAEVKQLRTDFTDLVNELNSEGKEAEIEERQDEPPEPPAPLETKKKLKLKQ